MRKQRGIVAGFGALLITIGTVAATAIPSQAMPPGDGCYPCTDPTPTTSPSIPSVTTISQLSPTFGWSGDAMVLKGYHFTNAAVTVQGIAPTITSRTDTQINFIVPMLSGNGSTGPVSVPIVVSGPYGTASTSFTLSPSLTISGGTTFGVNSQFGQGMDGSAWASATIDRFGGSVTATETVSNTQFWQSLTVNVSAVWLDSGDRVIGFTAPHSVTSTGIVLHWPSTAPVTNTDTWTTIIGPNAGVSSLVHSGRIVMVRDHEAELLSTLNTAVTVGQTIYQVLSTLASFV